MASHIARFERRVALHKYDPVELQHSFCAAKEAALAQQHEVLLSPLVIKGTALTVKAKELENSGVSKLVKVFTVNNNKFAEHNKSLQQRQLFPSRSPSTTDVPHFPPVVTPRENHGLNESSIISEMDRWDVNRRYNDDDTSFHSFGEDDCSDDELL